jgi:hypothetical protein
MRVRAAHCASLLRRLLSRPVEAREIWIVRHRSVVGRIAATVLLFAVAPVCPAELVKQSPDGLELVEGRRNGQSAAIVYVRPHATLRGYTRVQLDPVEIAFENIRARKNASLTAKDRERIRAEIAKEFRAVFTEELQKGGYEVVQTIGPDVLRVSPAIADLFIEAPDAHTSGRSRTYTVSAGHMVLLAELRDSESGAILARVADRRTASSPGHVLQWTTRTSNRADARRILRTWAQLLRTALDSAREAA